ncbi:MAG: RsmE family RNA methyltransferase [Phycisphaerae bacterium]
MPPPRLFCPELTEGQTVLSAEESHHAVAALRARPGQRVILFDGAGREACAVIEAVEAGRLTVRVERIQLRPFELTIRLTLAVAMGRAHRQGYLIEKCTELGVAAIQPVITARSVARPADRMVEKWFRRAVEAAKQSGRSWVPTIECPRPLGNVLENVDRFDAAFLALPGPGHASFAALLTRQRPDTSVLVWIGPEGGFTDEERRIVRESGAAAVTLAPTTLRTETAAVAACAICAAAACHGS